MKNTLLKSTLSAAAVALSLGLVTGAKADQLDETLVAAFSVPSETVTYSRAELTTEAGRETVERRIRRAAKAVCGLQGYRAAGGLSAYTEQKQCFNEAMAQAMSQVGADQVASSGS